MSPPTDTDWDAATATERLTQKKHIDVCMLREIRFKKHKSKTHELTLGQCTDALKNKLEATDGYELIEDSGDVVELLKHVKNIACKF